MSERSEFAEFYSDTLIFSSLRNLASNELFFITLIKLISVELIFMIREVE